jgi:hypothetical protein
MAARLEEAGLRRYELVRAGFHYSIPDATWWRGRHLRVSDEEVDGFSPSAWAHQIQRWMATRPPAPKGAVVSDGAAITRPQPVFAACLVCGERLVDMHEIALGRHLICQPKPAETM